MHFTISCDIFIRRLCTFYRRALVSMMRWNDDYSEANTRRATAQCRSAFDASPPVKYSRSTLATAYYTRTTKNAFPHRPPLSAG